MLDGVCRGDEYEKGGKARCTAACGEAIIWHGVILFMCISSSADDPPEPQRLEPVGVQGREVDDRVRPNCDTDERGAHSLITPAVRGALLLVLERLGLGDGGLSRARAPTVASPCG